MSDYNDVRREIERGMPPDALCTVCPWDRLCITPPTMDMARAGEQMKRMEAKVEAGAAHDDARMMTTLLGALVTGVQIDAAKVCPVLAIKLRSPEGRGINDLVRRHMRSE